MLNPKRNLPKLIAYRFAMSVIPTPIAAMRFASSKDLRCPSAPAILMAPNEPKAYPTEGMQVIIAEYKCDWWSVHFSCAVKMSIHELK